MTMIAYPEVLIEAPTAGAAITAAAATSMLPSSAIKTLEPNFFRRLGQSITIEASGIISSVITTPGTARFDVRFGSTTVFDGLAVLLDTVAAHTSVPWKLRITLTLRATGSIANLFPDAQWTCEDILGVPATAPKGVLTAMLPWNTNPPTVGSNFDASASQTVDLRFTQTVATGSCTLQTYKLISDN